VCCSRCLAGTLRRGVSSSSRAKLPDARSQPERTPEPIPGWFTASVERSHFTLIVGLEMGAAAPALTTWIAAKMLGRWRDLVTRPEIETGCSPTLGATKDAQRAAGRLDLCLAAPLQSRAAATPYRNHAPALGHGPAFRETRR
jgi:hypothetical protein